MISLNPLVGLVWVARHHSYAEAARCFPYPISQPGLFQQVRRLEDEIGLPLFARVGKDRMELTAAGRALYEKAAPFIEELDELVADMREHMGAVLRIEASALVLRQLLPNWILAMRAADPSMELRVSETYAPDPARLLQGKVDLLVDYLPGALPKGVASQIIKRARAYLVVPASSAKKPSMPLSSMGDADFVAYPANTWHREIQDRALARAGVTPRRVTQVGTADSIIALVAAGVGYSLVPWLRTRGPNEGVFSYLQRGIEAHFPIRCAWRTSGAVDPALMLALSTAPHCRQ